ncbi:putative argonaute sirna chaperone arc complex subunit arb1 [Golovinomyces cichoracearum]|uniref:Putative argonaute sirna chaperone arc complex subunit arb1 n=1 Tax=Golovinomyces cichoracearum TaxID=62708 RepID=A0A420IUU8_9PEZI|nr:putative argonaute sirna chaperone arc complex subunit arb1 [Golovinomyces cichoracearum]
MTSPNINPPQPDQLHLSSTLSSVDLNSSDSVVKEESERTPCHAEEPNPKTLPDPLIDNEKTDISKSCGILTPSSPPNSPPPTLANLKNDEISTPILTHESESKPAEVHDVEDKPAGKKKKKKRSGKSKSEKVKKLPVTGFEEFFADAPIRPDEHAEELDLYDHRMQSCIQRYRACRKLEQVRSNVFTKYLALGGIETGIKQFTGGLDKETLENSTAKEIADIQATDFIRTHPHSSRFYDGSENWVIDFEGVAKGFLLVLFSWYMAQLIVSSSYRLPASFPYNSKEQLHYLCEVIKNFLKYVLYHKVCPEYTADIVAACKIGDIAEKELWAIQKIASNLPGDFNVAASIIFGGRYSNVWQSEFREDENNDEENNSSGLKFSHARAELIFMAAVTISGGKDHFTRTTNSLLEIIKTEKKYFEVVEIHRPDDLTIERYQNFKDKQGKIGLVKPLGAVKLKRWVNPQLEEEEDFTDDESHEEDDEPEFESFWLEEEILQELFIGLKLELIVKELNIGIKFIDSFNSLYCSFHTYLPNEKMAGYKEPVPSNRPPLTEDDIDNSADDEPFDDD